METMETEVRYLQIPNETEFNDEERSISGYAIVFNSESEVLGNFVEKIESRALEGVDFSDTFLLFNHKYDEVLGSTKSGTMDVQITNKGLWFKAQLPNTTRGKDTYELIKRGDLSGMSFAFRTEKDEWNTRSKPYKRTIKKIASIDELSIVPRPAYKDTKVSTRALDTIECLNGMCEVNPLAEEAKEILNELKQKDIK